jgi:hypothetical protein
VNTVDDLRPVATLWQLGLAKDRLSCTIYRSDAGLQLRVETTTGVILTQPFDMQAQGDGADAGAAGLAQAARLAEL